MRVIISTGHGRLHLVQSAEALAKHGIAVRLILGWVPRRADGALVRLCSRLVGRDLSPGLKKRIACRSVCEVSACGLSETLATVLGIGARVGKRLQSPAERLGWSLFGWQSRRFIRNADVFHVRSGAGQGGAIRRARRLGMGICVDQSSLHPAAAYARIAADYARWNQPVRIRPKRGVWENVERDCRAADCILVNADHIKTSFVEQGYAADCIRVVYLGVRQDFCGLKRQYARQGPLRLVFTGSFSILKGAEYLLQALHLLKERGTPFTCEIVGNVGIPAVLRKRFEQPEVRYTGAIPQDNLKDHLASADVYVFPSLADGCASSGMEALAAGLCVVATVESGLPIVDGETGYLVPPRNVQAVADRIAWLEGRPDEVERVGRAAARLIREHYTWEHYAERVAQVYREIEQKKTGAAGAGSGAGG